MVKNNKTDIHKKRKKMAAKKPTSKTAIKQINASNSWQKFIGYVKPHKLLSAVVVVCLLAVGYYVWLQVTIAQERSQLNKAELRLGEFAADLEATLGPNADFKKQKGCAYRSVKYFTFGEKPTCSISYNGSVPVSSAAQATDYANQIDSKLNEYFEVTYKREGQFEDGKNAKPSETYGYDTLLGEVKCGLDIDYYDPSDKTTLLEENHEIVLQYGCRIQDSHTNHFAVDN